MKENSISSVLSNHERYLMNQVVVIVAMSSWFNIAKVHYINDAEEFWVDAELLRQIPDCTHTISLYLLGGIQ